MLNVGRTLIGLVFILAVAVLELAAQDPATDGLPVSMEPRLVPIPLDKSAPDVKAIRERGFAARPFAEVTSRSLSASARPEDKNFLAGIDLSKVDLGNVSRSVDLPRNLAADVAPDILASTTYGTGEDAPTFFETTYEALNATLTCHWAYDANISALFAAEKLKSEEEELERAFRRNQLGLPEDEELRSAQGIKPGAPEPPDPERDFVVKERQFKVAGRPCLLTVVCKNEADPRCDDHFIDSLARNVVTIRTGE